MEGFENATGGKIDDIKPEIDQFIAVFDKEIVENDVLISCMCREKECRYSNSTLAATIDGGMEFKRHCLAFGCLTSQPMKD